MEAIPNILIADDDPATRSVIKNMIMPLGVNIFEAEHGQEALVLLKDQRIDVVISDLVMPRMSGLMLLHSMLERGHHIPFILITGYGDKDSAIQALRLGSFDYLEKPVDTTDLQTITREAIKVSLEQQAWAKRVDDNAKDPSERSAEMLIMKMRACRLSTDEGSNTDLAADFGNVRNWRDLKDFFLKEAEQQLLFADGAIKSLLGSQSLTRELTFILRIIQSIRMASEGVRLTDLAEVAWLLECCLVGFRAEPKAIDEAAIQLFNDANQLILDRVKVMGSDTSRRVLERLEQASAKLSSQAVRRAS